VSERDAAGDDVVELAGVERLVGGAAGDPEPVADEAVQVDAHRTDAERGQGAAVDLAEGRAIGRGADVEGFRAPAAEAAIGQAAGEVRQRGGGDVQRAVALGGTESGRRGGGGGQGPADLRAVQQDRQAVAGEDGVVAGADVAEKLTHAFHIGGLRRHAFLCRTSTAT